MLAGAAWLVSTVMSLLAGGDLPAQQGRGLARGNGSVVRALLLELAAVLIGAVVGVGVECAA